MYNTSLLFTTAPWQPTICEAVEVHQAVVEYFLLQTEI